MNEIADQLNATINELEQMSRQLKQARGLARTSQFFDLVQIGRIVAEGGHSESDGGHRADVIALIGGWAIVHWLYDDRTIEMHQTFEGLRKARCSDGKYRLELISVSDEINPRLERPARGTGSRGTLSAQDQQMLRLLGQGRTNKEIALALGLSVSTVKNQIAGKIFLFLGVNTRTEAGILAHDVLAELSVSGAEDS